MITRVTRDVLDISTRPITDGVNIDGDGSTNFTIDGTIIGATTASTGNFTTLESTTFDVNSIAVGTNLSSISGSNSLILNGNGIRIVNNSMDFSNTSIASGVNAIEIIGGGIGADDALITFINDAGIAHFGLDSVDGRLKYGGGTVGGPFTVWHSGNDGAGSGLDADTLDGRQTGTNFGTIPIIGGAQSATTARTGLVSLARSFDMDDGGNVRAITPSSLLSYLNDPSNRRISSGPTFVTSFGFQRFPNGFLLQWGRIQHGAGGATVVTLPESFINVNSYQVVAGTTKSGTDGGTRTSKISGSQFSISGDTDNTGGPWIAIGF